MGKKNTCVHNLSWKLRSGVTVENAKALFSHDSRNIIIACGTDIREFIIQSGECVQTMKYHSRSVIALEENKKNMLQFYSCSDDGVVVLWDYTGTILQVYDLKMPVFCFYAPSPGREWFVTKKFEGNFRLYSVKPNTKSSKDADSFISKAEGCESARMILKPVLPKQNTVGFMHMGKYVASVHENCLTIFKFDSNSIIRHKTGERNLTCVACHPSDCILATGDNHGRVIVWTNALNSNHPVRSIYHWHSLPVADLAFSKEGSHIYSGGNESALVKWSLFSEERTILPRIGAPIKFVVTSKDNKYVLTTHSDNVLNVIDAQRNIVQVIQGLTRSQTLFEKILPVGLLYNAHLKSLVMNGKPGHLQFYNMQHNKLMFNLDIVCKNFLSQDRDTAVYNIDVQKAAFDDTGLWLATNEFWCNEDFSPQIWLKFWMFDLEKQTFVLNTNVYLPHNKDFNCMLFKPYVKPSGETPLLVTASNDGYFKIWILSTVLNESKQSWCCEYQGYYRDMIPTSVSFCEDGSVLAVAFGHIATLWRVENLALKGVLLSKENKRDIKQLLFGRHNGLRYLICQDGFSITAWDCYSYTIAWIVHFEVHLLVADIYSDNIAAFCKDQNLKIFKPKTPRPLDCISQVGDSRIVSAVFVPSTTSNHIKGCFNEKSQLYFIDEAQNLFTVMESEKDDDVIASQRRNLFRRVEDTPFGMLQATKIVSDVKASKDKQLNVSKYISEPDFIQNPTWQDPEVIFNSMMARLFEKKIEEKPKESEPKKVKPKEEDDKKREVLLKVTFEDDWISKSFADMNIKIDYDNLVSLVTFKE